MGAEAEREELLARLAACQLRVHEAREELEFATKRMCGTVGDLEHSRAPTGLVPRSPGRRARVPRLTGFVLRLMRRVVPAEHDQ